MVIMSSIIIKSITDTSIMVRKKVVYQDTDGQWIAVSELSSKESIAFEKYKAAYLDKGKTPYPLKEYK